MAHLAIGIWTNCGPTVRSKQPRKNRRDRVPDGPDQDGPLPGEGELENDQARTVEEIRNPNLTPDHDTEGADENVNIGEGSSNDNTRSATCPICGKSFSGFPGRRLHERKAHATEFHAQESEILHKKINKRWTDTEMYLLAQRDASLQHAGMSNIDRIVELSNEFERSIDTLRKRRTLPEYKVLLDAALEKLTERVELHVTPPVQIEPPMEGSNVNKPVQKRVATLWTIEEEMMLANKEAILTIDGKIGSEITEILSNGSSRSKESIRKRRSTQGFKQLVKAKIQELTQPIHLEVITEGPELRQELTQVIHLEVIHEEPELEVQDTPTPPPRLEEEDEAELNRQDMFKHWFTVAGESQMRNLWDPTQRMGINEAHEEIDKYTEEFMQAERLIKAERPTNVDRRKSTPPQGGRNSRRNNLMQLTQKKFEKDPSGCIRAILNDTLVNEGGVDQVLLREYWTEVFNKTPACEVFESKMKHPVLYKLSEPITKNEVEIGLKSLKTKSAAGVDGITCADLKKAKVGKIVTLFRVFQATSYTPARLRLGSVSMVPKVPEPTLPQHYRPITVASMLLRLYHGIIARRFEMLPISPRQKAYKKLDGIAENIWIVSELLELAKKNKKGIALIFLDVSKAFDSVGHPIIQQAAERLGVPKDIRKYLDVLYSTSELVFKGCSQKFKQNGGIRQGCQMSGPLFNGTADLGNEDLDPEVQFMIDEDVGIGEGLFADDEFLAAEGKLALQHQVDRVIPRYKKCGLGMNTSKCKTILIEYNAQTKRYMVNPKPFIKINGEEVPAVSFEETYKYLGVKLGAGTPRHKDILETLKLKLSRIDKSCLRPQQRLMALRRHIVPSLYHVLIFSKATKGSLLTLDRSVRHFVRKWCHIPKDTLNSMIHSDIKDGGLGIPALSLRIPRMAMQRHMRLSASIDPVIQAILKSEAGRASVARIHKTRKVNGIEVDTKQAEREVWTEEMYSRLDGKGMKQHRDSNTINDWVSDCSLKISGADFVRAIQIRLNTLKTPARAARGRRENGNNLCKLDRQVANSNHIFQVCQATHGLRIKRHDEVVDMLKSSMNRKQYSTYKEPRLKYKNTFRKPDLIITKKGKVVILDPIICSDTADLNELRLQKEILYGEEVVLEEAWSFVKTHNPGLQIKESIVHGVPMTFRGSLDNFTVRFLKRLGVPRRYLNLIMKMIDR